MKTSTSSTASIAALLALAAGSALAQPEPPAPARFDFDAALRAGRPALTAADAARLAEQRSPDVEAAQAAAGRARAGVARARVGLLPRVDLRASAMRIGGFEDAALSTGVPGAPEIAFDVPRNRTALRAQASYSLTGAWLSSLPAVRSAEARAEADRLRIDAARDDVQLAAVEAFYAYVEARGVLAVAEAAVRSAEEQRAEIAASARAGYAVEADVREAESRVAQTREGLARARAGVSVARTELEVVVGVDAAPEFALVDPLADAGAPIAGSEAELIARALDRRPELRAARLVALSQRRAERAARGATYPQLSVFAGTDYASPNPYVIPPEPRFAWSWEAGVTLSWSPTDALASARAADETAWARAETEARIAGMERAVRLQVRSAHARVEAAAESIEAAQARLDAAEQAYATRLAQLRAGVAVAPDVLAADAEVTRARLELLRARIELLVARARLRRAIGAPVACNCCVSPVLA